MFAQLRIDDPSQVVAAKINGEVRDLRGPLTDGDVALEPVRLDTPDGRSVMRHSGAHILAGAVKRLFPGTKLAHGPPTDDGFFYDMDTPRPLTEDDLKRVEDEMRKIVASDLPFERQEVSKEEARRICTERKEDYKLHYLESEAADARISFYRDGEYLDLCTGPHVPSTKWLRAFRVTRATGAYWLGDEKNRQLQRVYGIAFESEEALKAHLERIEEAKRRDHRRLGTDLDLFSIHNEVGGGLVHFHPHGAVLRRLLEDFWLRLHERHGYHYVYTPHLVSEEIYKISGHLENYADLMYAPMDIEGRPYRVKPMNCPGHIMIYKSRLHSYRELPLRYAEFGTVYRFEKSGVLHGLLRVRGFTIDDAHIFVSPEGVEDEVLRVFNLAMAFLRSFGFQEFAIYLSTKPADKHVGSDADWTMAEAALRKALERSGLKFGIDEGGGAFYGPKIDVKVKDCLAREWQCSTIQFDFNLPSEKRFDLEFIDKEGRRARPYMVHRALMGSVERFLGVLIEHFGGAFPLWLSPVQAVIISVTKSEADAAEALARKMRDAGFRVEVDASDARMGQKIRTHTMRKVPYLLVVGKREVEAGTVAVRTRAGGDEGSQPVDGFLTRLRNEAAVPPLPAAE